MLSVDPKNLTNKVGFVSLCKWDVEGSVGHWGHVHRRRNRYEAELRIESIDGAWRIAALELLNEERLEGL